MGRSAEGPASQGAGECVGREHHGPWRGMQPEIGDSHHILESSDPYGGYRKHVKLFVFFHRGNTSVDFLYK